MLLSIVIPHYNLPRELLTRCITSIFNQRIALECFEIIIVDDGSQERPFWVSDVFTKGNIRIIPIEHSGLSGARNRGIEEANGKYIMFVDSDDYIQPNSIHQCIETLKSESPQILRYDFKIRKSENDTTSVPNRRYKTSHTISGALFMSRSNLKGSACLYFFKKELATKHNIRFIDGIYHEDEDFTTRLHYHATTFIESNAVIYNYCIRPESITTSQSREITDKRIADMITTIKSLSTLRNTHTEKSNALQRKGLNRKIATLTADTLLNMYYFRKSVKSIRAVCKKELKPLGVYPLRPSGHSIKYTFFRALANNFFGLYILRILLPGRKPL